MKKNKLYLFVLLTVLSTMLNAQVTLPYYSGFDNVAEKTGWVEFKKAATTFSHWSYAGFGAYSPTVCLSHDYSPSTGITLTDNWYVSPAFNIPNGGKLDSIRHKFSGFSQPQAGDTIALYLLNGSQDPSLATSQKLLFDFRNSEYITDNKYRAKTNIQLLPSNGLSYLAIRYRNTNCSSNWLTCYFDNIAISENSSTGLITLSQNIITIYPNPTKENIIIKNAQKIERVVLQNIMGQSLFTLNNSQYNETIEISMPYFPKGIYFIKLFNGEQIETHKFLFE